MSSPVAIVLVIVAIPAMIALPALTYHALWKVWQGIPREQRRRHIIWQIVSFTVLAVVVAVVIIAPWGTDNTMLFLIGGACLLVFVGIAILVTQGFIRSRRTS